MESDSAEFTLPHAPRGLCFDRNDFVKINFSVDTFLADHQNVASLESMRDDLGTYLKVLRLAMIDLINKDYAHFVNLSTTLIGFDNAIAKIQMPLGNLNEEVISLKLCLEEAMKELSMWLNQRHALHKKKQLLKYYSRTIKCFKTLDITLLDVTDKKKMDQIALVNRAAMQYNQLQFYILKCENLIRPEQQTKYEEFGKKLLFTLNDLLLNLWNANDGENLLKVFLILSSLNKVEESENFIRKKAVAPLLQDIINEPSLQKSKDGLQGLYNKILELLETKLKLLLEVTQHSKLQFQVKRYRFLVNCFWCEVENRLEVTLASIFAPGNPKIFYIRYNESIQFIKKLEELCADIDTIEIFRKTTEYKNFHRRWNLPVYYQIRFQEIAGSFEEALHNAPNIEVKNGFLLKETSKCWEALHECWTEGVFIDALAHKFWKLTLQILSRYSTWAKTYCLQNLSPKSQELNKTLIENSINIYVDINTLIQKLPKFLNFVENKLKYQNNNIIKESLSYSEELLQHTKKVIKGCIVTELYENYNNQLKQVSDIPRLYRKTNRCVPSKPCTYIEVISKSIQEFNEDASRRLDTIFLSEIFTELFNILTASYLKYVEDVLISVQKTEESLRRLKQIRDLGSQQSNDAVGTTDGDKIRIQLNVDVTSYGKIAEIVKVNLSSIHKFKELRLIVTDAVKSINIK